MVYIYRARRMVRIVNQETKYPTSSLHKKDNRPVDIFVIKEFTKLNPKYTNQIAADTLSIALGERYLERVESNDNKIPRERIVLAEKGRKLIGSRAFYLNELAKSIGAIAPILISVLALFGSLYAVFIK